MSQSLIWAPRKTGKLELYGTFMEVDLFMGEKVLQTGAKDSWGTSSSAECVLWGMCGRSWHSHAIKTVWRLFETVPLSQVIVNLTVFNPRIRSLAPRGNLPHGDSERPLGETERRRKGVGGEKIWLGNNRAVFVEDFWTSYFMHDFQRNVNLLECLHWILSHMHGILGPSYIHAMIISAGTD